MNAVCMKNDIKILSSLLLLYILKMEWDEETVNLRTIKAWQIEVKYSSVKQFKLLKIQIISNG